MFQYVPCDADVCFGNIPLVVRVQGRICLGVLKLQGGLVNPEKCVDLVVLPREVPVAKPDEAVTSRSPKQRKREPNSMQANLCGLTWPRFPQCQGSASRQRGVGCEKHTRLDNKTLS